MNIILTGATGYLGSHLLSAFLEQGHHVIALKRSYSKLDRIASFIDQIEVVNIDQEPLEKAFTFGKVDVIVHTATLYGQKGESAAEVFQANVLFPLQLLQAGIQAGVFAFFNTDTFYNTETILYSHLSQYALSKKQFAEWGKLFARQQAIHFFNLKLEHMYDDRNSDEKFVNWVVKSCVRNVPELAFTSGQQLRDFIYIDDVIEAYLLLLNHLSEKQNFYQETGIGTGRQVSIRELVELIHFLSASTSQLVFGKLPTREHEFKLSPADTRLLQDLGWGPRYSLEQGLIKVIQTEKERISQGL